jgi:hypothetical protein
MKRNWSGRWIAKGSRHPLQWCPWIEADAALPGQTPIERLKAGDLGGVVAVTSCADCGQD